MLKPFGSPKIQFRGPDLWFRDRGMLYLDQRAVCAAAMHIISLNTTWQVYSLCFRDDQGFSSQVLCYVLEYLM